MKQQSILVVTAAFVVFGFIGCAQVNDTALALFSSSVTAVAVVDGQRMQGDMQVFPNHTGNVRLSVVGVAGAPSGPLTACMGRLRYTAASTGVVDLRCSGGVMADIPISFLAETRGYGYGKTATGTASLVFGLSELENQAHFNAPAGR